MRAFALFLVATTLTGCAAVDTYSRQRDTRFSAIGGGAYSFVARTHTTNEAGPDQSESRLEDLDFYLRENRLCPGGYIVEQRDALKTGTSMRGWYYELTYRIRCR